MLFLILLLLLHWLGCIWVRIHYQYDSTLYCHIDTLKDSQDFYECIKSQLKNCFCSDIRTVGSSLAIISYLKLWRATDFLLILA